ncbi:MAG: hybrid sensor histidine kinase/response regulator [Proteobacteria bacterium]|nr:hybrid sensor histidine kinase/response regulator [Pseudomonadota bacterium]
MDVPVAQAAAGSAPPCPPPPDTGARRARFVAVGADCDPVSRPSAVADAAAPGHRAEAPRDAGWALHDAWAYAPWFGATSLAGIAVLVPCLEPDLALCGWLVLAAGAHLVGAAIVLRHARRARRSAPFSRSARQAAAATWLVVLPLAVVPWLPLRAGTGAAWLVAGVPALVAVCGAAGFASLPLAASAVLAMPMGLALHALVDPAADGSMPAVVLVVASAAAGACLMVALASRRVQARWAGRVRAQAALVRQAVGERDAALRADQEKSRFLAIASHDLRQPVHAAGLFAATLEKRLAGAAEEPLAHSMMRSIEGLDRSFNAMLDVSRLDAGTVEVNLQRFALRDLFRRVHMQFAGQAEVAGLGLRLRPGGKSVTSDPQLLERIVGNLVQNALRYTERGGVAVVARHTATHLNIEVWDTGVGIAEDDLPRIFEEFYRAGRGRRMRAQGLGMGLAIVKRLAALLRLELTVASAPGRGTVFRIGVPLGGIPDIEDATAPADTLPMPLPASRSVLVIDDDEAIRVGLCLLLDEWGYEVHAAASAEQAERTVRALEFPPDLVLSDLHLGDGPDGIAAIDAVRAACGCTVQAVLITGDTSPAEMRRVGDSGHPVLFKPVQPRRLFNVLRGLSM